MGKTMVKKDLSLKDRNVTIVKRCRTFCNGEEYNIQTTIV